MLPDSRAPDSGPLAVSRSTLASAGAWMAKWLSLFTKNLLAPLSKATACAERALAHCGASKRGAAVSLCGISIWSCSESRTL